MRQIIRTVMPLNDGNIDSEGNFHNDDSLNAVLADVMTERRRRAARRLVTGAKRGDSRGRGTGESSD